MRIRYIELIRAGWGVALLVAPRAVLNRVPGVRVERRALVVTRILGARHLVQASLSGIHPTPEILAAGVWVDAVHSFAAVGLAVVDRDRVRAGLADSIVAALWAGAGLHDLRAGDTPTNNHAGWRDDLARKVFGALPGGRWLMDQAKKKHTQQRSN
jgi:hypothetical protein